VFKLFIEPQASIDIEKSCQYYTSLPVDTQRLVDHFLDDVFDAFDIITKNPYFQVKHKNYRVFPLNKFPYIIFFTIDEDEKTIKILALFNTAQNTTKYPT
jgi:toxin ParE1/3/4